MEGRSGGGRRGLIKIKITFGRGRWRDSDICGERPATSDGAASGRLNQSVGADMIFVVHF